MTKTDMPPLPEPAQTSFVTDSVMRNYEVRSFSAEQMRAYAAQEVAAERERLVRRGEEFAANVLQGDGDKAPALRGFLLAIESGA